MLESEIRLRKQLGEVAALRRQLPHGGKIKEEYLFEEGVSDLADQSTRETKTNKQS